jgi:hypothetical protein
VSPGQSGEHQQVVLGVKRHVEEVRAEQDSPSQAAEQIEEGVKKARIDEPSSGEQ